MDPTTLRLASLRLAPVQLAGWGHPESTGLPTIDGYLSAELFEPPEAADYYCERLLPLPNLGCYCQPYEQQPSAIDQAALGVASDRPVLLCPGMPFKYAPEHDIVFVEIARRLGRCQMVFFEPEDRSLSRKLHERLRRAFLEQQLSPDEYLLFIPWLPRGQFFALLRLADVCLDTIGFSGFNTALQAVECGLPMACYEGRFMRGRLASAVMTRMAMRDLVALNPGEFVDLAVRLASDRSFNQQMRVQLLAASPVLFRDRAAIDGLEQALVHLVRNRSAPASPVVTEP
jgi:predicted O-linked N-acetylglucosamine transferase (SPINDLY family)